MHSTRILLVSAIALACVGCSQENDQSAVTKEGEAVVVSQPSEEVPEAVVQAEETADAASRGIKSHLMSANEMTGMQTCKINISLAKHVSGGQLSEAFVSQLNAMGMTGHFITKANSEAVGDIIVESYLGCTKLNAPLVDMYVAQWEHETTPDGEHVLSITYAVQQ